LPRSEKAFAEQTRRARTRLPAVAEGAFRLLAVIAAAHHALGQKLSASSAAPSRVVAEVRRRRDALVYPGFFQATPWAQLAHLPRYLTALDHRLIKYPENPTRDARHSAVIESFWERYRERQEANRPGPPGATLEHFRWSLEELSVSLFAQELKTPYPVSAKRLEKAWSELCR
jgi:ATP-dependent helicase HrpA